MEPTPTSPGSSPPGGVLRFRGLRARFALVVLLAVLPLGVMAVYRSWEDSERAAMEAEDQALRLARSVSAKQEGFIEGARQLLIALAELRMVRERDGPACSALFAALLERYPTYVGLGAVTADGDVFCSGVPFTGRVNLSDRSWFRDAKATGDLAVGDYARGRVSRKESVGLGYPVRDAKGRLQGVVFAGLNLDWLNRLAATVQLPPGGVAVVVDVRGTVVARNPKPETWVGKVFPDAALVRAVLTRREGQTETLGLDGVRRFFGFAPLGGARGNLFVAVGLDRSAALAPARSRLARELLGLGMAGAVALLGAWWVADALILRRVRKLVAVARRLGTGDLGARTGLPHSGGELGVLTRAFDEMAVRLEARERELREAHDQLEARVRERTAALAESEARFRGLFEAAGDAILIANAEGRILLANAQACHVFGYPLEELLGLEVDALLPEPMRATHPTHRAGYHAAPRARAMNSGLALVGRRKDGSEVALEISLSHLQSAEGLLAVAVVRDISERRRSESLLGAIVEGTSGSTGDEFFRSLVRHLSLSLGIRYAFVGELTGPGKDRVRTLAVWSGAEFGSSFEYALAGTPCQNVVGRTMCMYPAQVAQQFPEDPLLADMGVESYAGIPLFSSSGEPLGLLTVMDVRPMDTQTTIEAVLRIFASRAGAELERKQSEETLRASQRLFRALIEQSADGIMLLAAGGLITYAGPSTTRILGYTAGELVGRDAFELVHPEDLAGARTQLAELLATPSEPARTGFRVRHRDDSYRWLEGVGTNLLSEPAVQAVVVNYRDITEARALEEQFRQSQKMEAIGRLAGGIAHDFNNLLTVILGRSNLALLRSPLDAPTRRDIELIRMTGERAAALTNQLLAFSRRQVLQPRLLDLNRVVEDMQRLLRQLIGEDLELVTVPAPGLGRVKADPGQIDQVIVNLAVNAKDAMPRGGRLTLETANADLDESDARLHAGASPGRYVMLAVSDTGVGMDPETQARIFEPFFTTKAPGKGTGLGLATVYGIAKQSGGYIWVYSEAGRGTTFKVYLPRVDEPAEPELSTAVAEQAGRGSETILLVEDEGAVRSLTREILEQHGYTVLEGASPAEGLDLASRHPGPIHLLLTDVVMPGMSGRELGERLLASHPHLGVLYMSGYSEETISHHGFLDRDVLLVQKPFTATNLVGKVQEALGRRA